MNKKKLGIIIGAVVVAIAAIAIVCCLSKGGKTYKSWEAFVKTYKDVTIELDQEKTNYSNTIELKNKKVVVDNKTVMSDVIKVYAVDYNGDNYVYLVTNEGKLFYMNNINMSTMDKNELTELGDYKKIISIEVKDNKILAKDIEDKEIDMTPKLKSYIQYSKQ